MSNFLLNVKQLKMLENLSQESWLKIAGFTLLAIIALGVLGFFLFRKGNSSKHNRTRPPAFWTKTNIRNLFGETNIDVLYFYDKDEPFYFLTNFYQLPNYNLIKDNDGNLYKTSEHYFQAKKFTDPRIQDLIRSQINAREAFRKANARENQDRVRRNWHSGNPPQKIKTMKEALEKKFYQNEFLEDALKITKNAILVENAGSKDNYWGAGDDLNGRNWLGILLMELRNEMVSDEFKIPDEWLDKMKSHALSKSRTR